MPGSPTRAGLIAALIASTACSIPGIFPSDNSLRRNFFEKEDSFSSLLKLFDKDRYLRVAPSFADAADGTGPLPSRQQWDLYRRMFKQTHTLEAVKRDDGVILFTTYQTGFLSQGWYKGYAYRKTPPVKVYSQLDKPTDGTFADCNPHYASLRGDWYLYIITCM